MLSEGFHWHVRHHLITVLQQNVSHVCRSELAKAVPPLLTMHNRTFPRHHRVPQDCTIRHKTTSQPATAITWHFFLRNITIFPHHLAPHWREKTTLTFYSCKPLLDVGRLSHIVTPFSAHTSWLQLNSPTAKVFSPEPTWSPHWGNQVKLFRVLQAAPGASGHLW